jgi:hypothetical protein
VLVKSKTDASNAQARQETKSHHRTMASSLRHPKARCSNDKSIKDKSRGHYELSQRPTTTFEARLQAIPSYDSTSIRELMNQSWCDSLCFGTIVVENPGVHVSFPNNWTNTKTMRSVSNLSFENIKLANSTISDSTSTPLSDKQPKSASISSSSSSSAASVAAAAVIPDQKRDDTEQDPTNNENAQQVHGDDIHQLQSKSTDEYIPKSKRGDSISIQEENPEEGQTTQHASKQLFDSGQNHDNHDQSDPIHFESEYNDNERTQTHDFDLGLIGHDDSTNSDESYDADRQEKLMALRLERAADPTVAEEYESSVYIDDLALAESNDDSYDGKKHQEQMLQLKLQQKEKETPIIHLEDLAKAESHSMDEIDEKEKRLAAKLESQADDDIAAQAIVEVEDLGEADNEDACPHHQPLHHDDDIIPSDERHNISINVSGDIDDNEHQKLTRDEFNQSIAAKNCGTLSNESRNSHHEGSKNDVIVNTTVLNINDAISYSDDEYSEDGISYRSSDEEDPYQKSNVVLKTPTEIEIDDESDHDTGSICCCFEGLFVKDGVDLLYSQKSAKGTIIPENVAIMKSHSADSYQALKIYHDETMVHRKSNDEYEDEEGSDDNNSKEEKRKSIDADEERESDQAEERESGQAEERESQKTDSSAHHIPDAELSTSFDRATDMEETYSQDSDGLIESECEVVDRPKKVHTSLEPSMKDGYNCGNECMKSAEVIDLSTSIENHESVTNLTHLHQASQDNVSDDSQLETKHFLNHSHAGTYLSSSSKSDLDELLQERQSFSSHSIVNRMTSPSYISSSSSEETNYSASIIPPPPPPPLPPSSNVSDLRPEKNINSVLGKSYISPVSSYESYDVHETGGILSNGITTSTFQTSPLDTSLQCEEGSNKNHRKKKKREKKHHKKKRKRSKKKEDIDKPTQESEILETFANADSTAYIEVDRVKPQFDIIEEEEGDLMNGVALTENSNLFQKNNDILMAYKQCSEEDSPQIVISNNNDVHSQSLDFNEKLSSDSQLQPKSPTNSLKSVDQTLQGDRKRRDKKSKKRNKKQKKKSKLEMKKTIDIEASSSNDPTCSESEFDCVEIMDIAHQKDTNNFSQSFEVLKEKSDLCMDGSKHVHSDQEEEHTMNESQTLIELRQKVPGNFELENNNALELNHLNDKHLNVLQSMSENDQNDLKNNGYISSSSQETAKSLDVLTNHKPENASMLPSGKEPSCLLPLDVSLPDQSEEVIEQNDITPEEKRRKKKQKKSRKKKKAKKDKKAKNRTNFELQSDSNDQIRSKIEVDNKSIVERADIIQQTEQKSDHKITKKCNDGILMKKKHTINSEHHDDKTKQNTETISLGKQDQEKVEFPIDGCVASEADQSNLQKDHEIIPVFLYEKETSEDPSASHENENVIKHHTSASKEDKDSDTNVNIEDLNTDTQNELYISPTSSCEIVESEELLHDNEEPYISFQSQISPLSPPDPLALTEISPFLPEEVHGHLQANMLNESYISPSSSCEKEESKDPLKPYSFLLTQLTPPPPPPICLGISSLSLEHAVNEDLQYNTQNKSYISPSSSYENQASEEPQKFHNVEVSSTFHLAEVPPPPPPPLPSVEISSSENSEHNQGLRRKRRRKKKKRTKHKTKGQKETERSKQGKNKELENTLDYDDDELSKAKTIGYLSQASDEDVDLHDAFKHALEQQSNQTMSRDVESRSNSGYMSSSSESETKQTKSTYQPSALTNSAIEKRQIKTNSNNTKKDNLTQHSVNDEDLTDSGAGYISSESEEELDFKQERKIKDFEVLYKSTKMQALSDEFKVTGNDSAASQDLNAAGKLHKNGTNIQTSQPLKLKSQNANNEKKSYDISDLESRLSALDQHMSDFDADQFPSDSEDEEEEVAVDHLPAALTKKVADESLPLGIVNDADDIIDQGIIAMLESKLSVLEKPKKYPGEHSVDQSNDDNSPIDSISIAEMNSLGDSGLSESRHSREDGYLQALITEEGIERVSSSLTPQTSGEVEIHLHDAERNYPFDKYAAFESIALDVAEAKSTLVEKMIIESPLSFEEEEKERESEQIMMKTMSLAEEDSIHQDSSSDASLDEVFFQAYLQQELEKQGSEEDQNESWSQGLYAESESAETMSKTFPSNHEEHDIDNNININDKDNMATDPTNPTGDKGDESESDDNSPTQNFEVRSDSQASRSKPTETLFDDDEREECVNDNTLVPIKISNNKRRPILNIVTIEEEESQSQSQSQSPPLPTATTAGTILSLPNRSPTLNSIAEVEERSPTHHREQRPIHSSTAFHSIKSPRLLASLRKREMMFKRFEQQLTKVRNIQSDLNAATTSTTTTSITTPPSNTSTLNNNIMNDDSRSTSTSTSTSTSSHSHSLMGRTITKPSSSTRSGISNIDDERSVNTALTEAITIDSSSTGTMTTNTSTLSIVASKKSKQGPRPTNNNKHHSSSSAGKYSSLSIVHDEEDERIEK